MAEENRNYYYIAKLKATFDLKKYSIKDVMRILENHGTEGMIVADGAGTSLFEDYNDGSKINMVYFATIPPIEPDDVKLDEAVNGKAYLRILDGHYETKKEMNIYFDEFYQASHCKITNEGNELEVEETACFYGHNEDYDFVLEKIVRKSKRQFDVYKDMYEHGISHYKLIHTCEYYDEAKEVLESDNKKDTSGFITVDGIILDSFGKYSYNSEGEAFDKPHSIFAPMQKK